MNIKRNEFILGIVVALFGLTIIINPAIVAVLAAIVIGICSIVDGVYVLKSVKPILEDKRFRLIMTIRGWFDIVIGVLAIALPIVFIKVAWAAMVYMLAISLILSALLEIYGIIQLNKNEISIKPYVMEIIYSLIIAIVLFIIPAESLGAIIIRICGIVLIIGGVLFTVYEFKNRSLVIEPDSVSDDVDDVKTDDSTPENSSEKNK